MGTMPPSSALSAIPAHVVTTAPAPLSATPSTLALASLPSSLLLNASLPVVQPSASVASVAVPTGLFLGDGVLPLPQKLMRKILALEFIEMRELLLEEWLTLIEEGENSEQHSCCNSVSKKRKVPVTNIFTWLQGYALLVGALSTTFPSQVPELMAYQTTILRCYRDFKGPAWAQYDRANRRRAALSKDLKWLRINTTLYSLCFAGRAKRGHVCAHYLSNNHSSDGCPEAPSSSTPCRAITHQPPAPSTSQDICRLFNARGESKYHYKHCKFAHACARCRGGHPASACPQNKGSGEEAAGPSAVKRQRSKE